MCAAFSPQVSLLAKGVPDWLWKWNCCFVGRCAVIARYSSILPTGLLSYLSAMKQKNKTKQYSKNTRGTESPNMWRAAVPASYTILSVRSMPVAFCFRETRLRANLIPSFPSQVFSIQMIMIIHTTDGFTSRWPCLDCQIVPVFFKKNYDDVEWQEIMSRLLYGTYISISSIETIRKSSQKHEGPTVSPFEWRHNQSTRENRPPCGMKNKTWLCVTNNVVQKVAWSPKKTKS